MPKIKIPLITVICFVGLIIIEPSEYLLLILISVFIHEAGHLLTMGAMGIKPQRITLLPIGIDIVRKQKYISYPKEMLISLSGALANISVFFIFGKYPFFACTNLLYAIINLLPVKGLDGGYALEAFLLCFCSVEQSERITKVTSFVFCILLWVSGVYILLILNGNISIFALSVFLFVSVYMK